MSIINKLQKFVFDEAGIPEVVHRQPKPKSHNTPVRIKRTGVFTPHAYDTLFWCFYIIENGHEAYHMTGNHKFQIEKNKKISFIEKIRANKTIMKAHKLKINAIENDLLNNRYITKKTFIALCILYDINIIIIFDNYYYKHNANVSNPIHIIRADGDSYGLDTQSTNIDKEISKLWRLENISKPLKGISAYKIGELHKIYKTLFPSKSNDLQTMKSTKKILYNLIRLKIE